MLLKVFRKFLFLSDGNVASIYWLPPQLEERLSSGVSANKYVCEIAGKYL